MHDVSDDTATRDPLRESEVASILATRMMIVRLQDRLRIPRLTGPAEERSDLTRLDETLHAADEALFRFLNVASSYLRSRHAGQAIDDWLGNGDEADES